MMSEEASLNDAPLPPAISGKWVILAVAGLGILGSGFGWLWLYNAQRMPRDFWGYGTWRLIGRAERVDALLLNPEPPAPADKPHPIWYDGLIVVQLDPRDAARYVVAERKAVERAAGISLDDQSSSLREALAHHRSYDWDSMAAKVQTPVWRYGLTFTEGPRMAGPSATPPPKPDDKTFVPEPPAVTLLFDAECKFVRTPLVDKPVSLVPGIAEQFQKFFLTTFPQKAE